MPGNILKINVTQGQAVNEGDVLMILEAMKMENEIVATKAGTIAQISVTKGAVVETGTVLAVIA
jgi:biotin carboxyl carrier protein